MAHAIEPMLYNHRPWHGLPPMRLPIFSFGAVLASKNDWRVPRERQLLLPFPPPEPTPADEFWEMIERMIEEEDY